MHTFARLSLALLITLSPLGAQTLVYSVPAEANNDYPTLSVSEGSEYASAIQLAGTDRDLQSATVSVYSDVARTAVVTFSIFQAVPEDRGFIPSGSTSPVAGLRPTDDPLWTSGPVMVTFTSGGASNFALNQLVFSGINTLVSSDIFWSISFMNVSNTTSNTNFGPKMGDASAVYPAGAANDPGQLYLRDPDTTGGEWLPATLFGNETAALTITLNAVPEPTAPLLIAGFAVFGFIARRRRA